jgi:hypothetical protein
MDYQYDKRKLVICYQNIRGLRNKTNEILCHLYPELPHFLSLTEHRSSKLEIQSLRIENYTLGDHYCRNQMLKGGVCISVNNSINYSNLNLDDYSTDKDFEVCAIQLNLLSNR